jgi:UDP-N-acetylmuramoylalanine-D-glutamate ligase
MIQNAMAAMAIVHLLDVDPGCARAAIRNFKGLPHRMVDLGEYQGVRYINDSKGTNTGASIAAVKSVAATGPIHLLAGGDTKGAELGSWAQIMRQCTKRVYLYGADATRMQDALSDHALTFETLDEALAVARSEAAAGEVVLLSPAAASFDQFSDYQARGRHFEALVRGFHEA